MCLAVPIVFRFFFLFFSGSYAVDDDIDASDILTGHFLDLLSDTLLDFIADCREFDTEAQNHTDFDLVVTDFVFIDADTALIAFFGKDLCDSIDEATANCGDANDFECSQANNARDHTVIDADVT